MPRASVVMPVYNAAQSVGRAVESVLSQSYGDFSLIIVDDGSTDESLEIIRSFADSRITVLENGENRGIEYSLNRGVKAADCEWVFRLDSDDECAPGRLDAQLEFLETHPEIWVLGSWAELLFDGGGVSLGSVPVQNGQIKARLLFHSAFFHPAVAVRRELFEWTGYSAKYPRAEDYDLWCRLALNPRSRFFNLPEALIRYRVSERGLSLGGREKQLASTREVRENFLRRAGIENQAGLDLYHAMSDGILPAAVGPAAVETFFVLLGQIKKWNLISGYAPAGALSAELTPRFTSLTNRIAGMAADCAEMMKKSEFYQRGFA